MRDLSRALADLVSFSEEVLRNPQLHAKAPRS